MLNPLINKHPTDTLHCIYCVLDLLESLPNEDPEGAFLNRNQAFGYYCVMQCVKNALLFESDRVSKAPATDSDDVPHPAGEENPLPKAEKPILRRVLAGN